MAVTSLSRFLRAHTCAPPRPTPTATTRGREGGGLHAQPLPRSVSPHTWRAPPSGSCRSVKGRGSKGDDADAGTCNGPALSAFFHSARLALSILSRRRRLVACSSPLRKREKRAERRPLGTGGHVGPARWIGAGRRTLRDEERLADTRPTPAPCKKKKGQLLCFLACECESFSLARRAR